MRKILLATTALISTFLSADVFADHYYPDTVLTVSSGDVTNPKTGYFAYDEEEELPAYNYKSISVTGGKLTLNDFKVRSGEDATITGGTVVLNNGMLKAKQGNLNISGGVINAIDGEIHAKNINVTNGTINLQGDFFFGLPDTSGKISISGGTINMQGGGVVLGTGEQCDEDWCTSGTFEMTGGKIVIENGKIISPSINSNYIEAQNINIKSGTIEIKDNAYLETVSLVRNNENNQAIEKYKGFITLSEGGTINLQGVLYSAIQSDGDNAGTINVKSSNAVIDGDFDGANLNIFANATLSQLITGDIYSFGALNIKSGKFILNKLPEDEDAGVKSFTLENGATFEGIELVSNGEVNINGGTFNSGHGLFVESASFAYSEDAADLNISGGTVTVSNAIYNKITGQQRPDYGGEVTLVGNANMNISGANTVINMDFANAIEDNHHDGGILHEGKLGNINISGGTINLVGKVAKIERGGYDGDWIYSKAGEKIIDEDELYEQTGMWLGDQNLSDEQFYNAIGYHLWEIDTDQYHVSEGNINISGGTINLQDGSRISMTEKHTGDINITGGTINGIKTQNIASQNDDEIDSGKIEHLGTGDINIKGNAIINFVASEIQKGFHEDDSDRAQGNVNISENARITLSEDTHINSDQNVNISGGTTSLTYNGSIDAYGDINVSGGTLNIGEENGTPLSLEEDDWSAISSHYKDGNVKISGGTINLYNNGAIGRIANIDDGMDKSQFGDRITGDIDISGGKIIANGNSEIIVASGDGLEDIPVYSKIKISKNADITLKDDVVMENRSLGNIEMTGGSLSLNDDSRLRGDSSFNISGGTLVINTTKGADAKNVNISGNAAVSVNAASFTGMEELNISGGTISLQSAELAAVESEGLGQRQDSTFTMSDGTLNVENSIIGAMIHQNWKADDDIYQGNKVNITGGEININQGTNYLIGSDINFDGTMNIASGTTLNVYEQADYSNANSPETVAFSTKGTLKTDGTNDDAEGINLSGTLVSNIQGDGGLTFKTSSAKVIGNIDGSSVSFMTNHTLAMAINGTINSLKSLNIGNNSTLTYNKSGVINPISEVNVTAGSTLRVGENLGYATFYNSDMQIAGTIDGDIWGDTNNSTLKFAGETASITGNAMYFKEMEFDGTNMTLENQSFDAGELTIDNSTLDFNGSVIMQATDIAIIGSTINVSGLENSILASNGISLTNSDIYIKKNSELTLSAKDSNSFDVNNSTIHMNKDTQLKGNFNNAAALDIGGGPSIDDDEEIIGGNAAIGNISSFIGGQAIDLGDLVIYGKANLTLDKGGIFTFSDDNEDYKREYITGQSNNKTYMEDEIEYDDDEELDEDEERKPYENQIVGKLAITGQSTLTAKSNFASDEIEVDDHSTLIATDQILGARTLTVNNGSNVNLTGNKKDVLSGFDESVTVKGSSKLSVQNIDIGDCGYGCDNGELQVLDNSTLEVINGDLGINTLSVKDSIMTLTDSRMRSRLNNSTDSMKYQNANVTVTNSFIYNDGITSISNSTIKLQSDGTLTGTTTKIMNNSNITANNSHIGAFKKAIDADREDKEVYLELRHGTWLPEDIGYEWQSDLTIADSAITLNGNSELGTGLAITEYNEDIDRDTIVGYLTQEMADNQQVLFDRYPDYDTEDFGDSLEFVRDYKSAINISGTNITMNGTSAIINAMLNIDDDSGNIYIADNSTVTVNGNNKISAASGTVFTDSNLTVNKGATLTVESLTGFTDEELAEVEADGETKKDLYLEHSTLNLAGVINANIIFDDEEVVPSTLTLNGGRVVGNVRGLKDLTLSSVQNGKTSTTLNGTTFTDLANLTISGANTNITLDSSVFKTTDGENRWYIAEDTFGDTNKTYYYPMRGEGILEWVPVEEPNATISEFDNQINGDLTISNKATLNINKDFAAESINVNNATLVANDAYAMGNLNLANKANVTLGATQRNMSDYDIGEINVVGNSTLNFNNLWWIENDSTIIENATLNLNHSNMDTSVTLNNANVNITSGWLRAQDANEISDSIINLSDADFIINYGSMENTIIDIANNSYLNLRLDVVKSSEITAQNSKIVASTQEMWIDEDGEEWLDAYDTMDLNFINSTIKLNGSANLEATSHIKQYDFPNRYPDVGIDETKGTLRLYDASNLIVSGLNNNLIAFDAWLLNSTLNINQGAVLNVQTEENGDSNANTIKLTSSQVELSGTLNGNISDDGTSTLTFKNNGALTGNAENLETISFANAKTAFENQTLTANNISLSGSTLDFKGGVVMEALSGNISLANNSIINILSGENEITASDTVKLTNSRINIKKDATLALNAADGNHFDFKNSLIKISHGGELSGNIWDLSALVLDNYVKYGATIEDPEFNVPGQSGNVSKLADGQTFTNLGDLIITGNSNITLDVNNMFKLSDEDEEDKRRYETGTYMNKTYYVDETDFRGDENEDDTYKTYENQILGKLQIENSKVTAKTNFAADEIEVKNKSTLTATDYVLGGRTLTIDGGSTVSLLGSKKYIQSGFDESVTVKGGSTLISNMFRVGGDTEDGHTLTVAENSTLTLSNGETHANIINIDNSTLNLTKARFKADGENDTQMTLNKATVNANNSLAHIDGNLNVSNSKNIKLSNKAALFGDNATITKSTITLDNSQVGAFAHALKIDAEDKDITNRLSYHYGEPIFAELNITGSDITLNGTSELGAYMAITEWTTTPGLGSIVGHVTKEIAADASVLLAKYKGYELNEDQFGEHNSVLGAYDHQAVVNIADTNITMNGTSAIINAMLNAEDNSGDINIKNGSNITAKGKGNLISAAGDINFEDATLTIAKGAVLNIESLTALEDNELEDGESRKDLYLSGSTLDLAGTLNANVIFEDEGENASTFILNGGRVVGSISGLKDLAFGTGQNGNTSKTLTGTIFTNLENVVISGANTKITLDSSVFKVSENERYYWYDNAEKEYKDEQDDNYPGPVVMIPYDNQILGDFDVKNGATLTLAKHLVAENINVNGATLISNNALLAGNIKLSNKATATINGAQLGGLYVDNIDVQDNSTLNLNSIEYMKVGNLTVNDSALNTTKWTEMMVDELNLTNAKTNIATGGAWIGANTMTMNGGTMDVVGAEVNLYDAEINDAKITISKNTTLGIQDASFDHSTLTLLDTSKIGAAGGVGNILFDNNSNLVIKGKNNIETQGGIYVSDSTLEVAQGAVLNVQSESGNVINVDNARIKLAGTLNATFAGTIDTLILGTKASYIDGALDGLAGNINSFGISGITAAKDIARLVGGIDNMVTFEITDKSNFTWDNTIETNFENLNVENSTLSIKGDKSIWAGDINTTGSTVKILAGTLISANEMNFENTALTITGTALKKGETEYADLISTINGLNVDNSGNTKSAVSISNIALNTDVNISNVAKVTLKNISFSENLNIAGTVTETAKGYTYNTVATLNNVIGGGNGNLMVDDAKATVQKGNAFENIAVVNKGTVEFKDNIETDLALSDMATATLASKKVLTGDVTLNDDSHFVSQGIIDGDVSGNGGLLEFSNTAAKVNGDVEGIALGFNKTKANLSQFFGGNVDNITATKLSGATITDNMNNVDFGNLWMQKSTLTLQNSAEATSLTADASTLNLGTNTLTVNGDAELTNKSTISVNVDSNKKYGKLIVGGTLTLGADAKGNATTNLAVTLDKTLVNTKFHTGEPFNFLEYGEVEGTLSKVTIANNRITFTETTPGQFEITEVISGKGVIERYAALNPMSAAAAIVDSTTEFTSAKQNKLADDLNALSQVVGGEQAYINALDATNPDDNNMVAENTVSTVETVLSAVAERTSSSGITSATEGMASGDTPNGASVWTKVLYNKAKLDSTSSYAGFKSNSNGLAMGVDKFINKDVKLGLAYAYTDGDIKNNIRKSDVDTHTAILYGEYKPSEWFINGSLSYGWSDYSNKAFSALGTTKSDFDAYAAAIQLNTGYDINVADKTTLTPVIGMRYINMTQDSYKDSDDKHISKAHSDIVTALAGAKLKKSFELTRSAVITPEARLGISYDIVNDGNNSVVKLSNGSSYMVEGRALKRFGFEAGAGITAELNDAWEISAGYEGRFRKDYYDHTGMLSLKYNF